MAGKPPDRARRPEPRGVGEGGAELRRRTRSGTGRPTRSPGASSTCRRASSASSPTSRARTSSSSAAAPRTSRPGSRVAAHGRSASTSPRSSSRRRGAMQAKHGLEFPLVHASAEDVPLPDASFDLAVSEYGATIWCDPDLWIAEAARLLRPGGELVFLVNGTFRCSRRPTSSRSSRPATELLRPYFGMRRFEWESDDSIDFHLGYGDWIRVADRRTASRSSGWSSCATPGADPGGTTFSPRSGQSAGRPRRCGRRARSRERFAGAAAAARLDLAAAPRDPRAARASRSTSSHPGYEEHDPADADPVELVRAHAQGKARSVAGEAGDRPVLGVDTTVVCRDRVYGKARGREEAAEMLEALGGRHARGRLRPLPAHAGVGGAGHRDDARDVPTADGARHRRVRRLRRVGGPRRARTRSRAAAPRSSSGSRATT